MVLYRAVFLVLLGRQTAIPKQTELISLARQAVTAEVTHAPLPVAKEQDPPQPLFVTIEENGKVLGCRGDLAPRTKSLEDEVILAARGAAEHDPRYGPISQARLKNFLVTVTLVEALTPISSVDGIEPGDGLVLESGDRKGIVLPWEGRDPHTRLDWAYKKAGVQPGTPAQLLKMRAERFRG